MLASKTPGHGLRHIFALVFCSALFTIGTLSRWFHSSRSSSIQTLPRNAEDLRTKCSNLRVIPGPTSSFYHRTESDRFQQGTKPILLLNATIWTGTNNGPLTGHIYVDGGIIKSVGSGNVPELMNKKNIRTWNLQGAWVTPGIIDVHSHLSNQASPQLKGADDGNSNKGPILPWLRSLDALNTHDAAFVHSIAGGITTSLILPGSANAIAGQAFVMKLRPTKDRSPTSMLVEPPLRKNGSEVDPHHWRHMKHACGENPARVYSATRMDTVWSTRQAYDKARKIKQAQDEFCEKVFLDQWDKVGEFPEELQWEALVDVLRGRVKVQTHCYEAVDLDGFVRLSNEFQFPIAAFHHAHEAYLVSDVLKRAYGEPPAVAIFASFGRYKRESWRGSEFAPRILNDAGLRVAMKSDHPAINSRYLIHEAQQAHHYGLPAEVALASVTTHAARILGLDHRIGKIAKGYDADIVVWDSHPLALGVTPTQVIIDGIPQIDKPFASAKPNAFQNPPKAPNYDQEAAAAVKFGGLPPLEVEPDSSFDTVVFTNVSSVWVRDGMTGVKLVQNSPAKPLTVLAQSGKLTCTSNEGGCSTLYNTTAKIINLQRGSIMPGLVSFGSQLGLQEIAMEESTIDGAVYDPLSGKPPSIIGGAHSVIRASDGLQFGTRNALLAYRAGVTSSIVPPLSHGFLSGLSTSFSLGSKHRLERGALIQEIVALHVSLSHTSASQPSISSQIAALRKLLLQPEQGDLDKWFAKVTKGEIVLAVSVHEADTIASLIALKKEVEKAKHIQIKLALVGATEAHLLAKEIAEANIGVIVYPARSFPFNWETRRYLPGPPYSQQSLVAHLHSHGVKVGMSGQGIELMSEVGGWAQRNLRWDAGWAQLESNGSISKTEVLAMVTTNIEHILGMKTDVYMSDMVATSVDDLFSFESRVVAVISPRRGKVDVLVH